MTRKLITLFLIFFVISAILPPVLGGNVLINRGEAKYYIDKYQLRTLSYPWDSTESISAWSTFKDNESFYLTCLKVIALARSGYPRNSSDFQALIREIESRQGKDGSFPAIITDDYIEPDSEWFYWELSKAAGTGLAILALLEAGESPDSKEIEKATRFLLKNESENHWTSKVYLYWDKTGLHRLNESPSLVATAYAVAALSRVGHNVSREWEWLRERLTPERLVEPYADNFFTGFIFPMPYRDMRAPYESVALPLLFLREENMTVPRKTLDFISSLLKETQYVGNATLRLSFKGVTNYTVEERTYTANGWETVKTWKGLGKNTSIKLGLGISDWGSRFAVISREPLLPGESGFFKGGMRLYSELPRNYILFVGTGYTERGVFQFSDGRNYAVIESPNLDGSWNHDVYSTAIALIWLHLAGEKGGNINDALRFLELATPKESMSFDGEPYALIALSLYGRVWEENKPVPLSKERERENLNDLVVPLVAGVLIGVFMGILLRRR
ncbi:prenyltransferase/squalene oxidase repeat-containing protein [Thermococcus sp.]